MQVLGWILYWLIGLSWVAYQRWSLKKSLVGIGCLLSVATILSGAWGLSFFAWVVFIVSCIALSSSAFRRSVITERVFKIFQRSLPKMSETEKTALEASTPWWESEFFKGNPNWDRLFSLPKPTLTAEEQAFLDGPVEEVCAMTNNWQVAYEDYDLSPEVWRFLKEKGFMGFIIPKAYGGLGFSGLAHSAIAAKVAGHSPTLSVTISVPNTLGPAELLMHYGTQAQKNHYLPRLARGEEIPCFALTGPDAGSDAGSIPDAGIVEKGMFEGKEIIGIRLNWKKRYITLAPLATVIGLAFKLYDPDQLFFDKIDLGITCALIPAHTKGIQKGRRHLPAGSPFQNGPIEGHDVFIPLEWIIGGPDMAGHGWRMLVECLASGRAITLPGSSAGGARVAALVCGAYASIRQQFKAPISAFEGIQEMLAKIAGFTYLCEATRTLTAQAVNLGEKPAVPSAIAKYQVTELSRQIALMAMDIHGGKAVMMGPKNYVVGGYQSAPIAITVEGANILTRNLIIFGQGAMCCHPYLLAEMEAVQKGDKAAFEKTLFEHIQSIFYHIGACVIHGFTQALHARVPKVKGYRFLQKITQASHAFALVGDIILGIIGGKLKFKENLSARLSDMLSALYLASACIKRFRDQGEHDADLPLLQWAVEKSLSDFWNALSDLLANFPNRPIAWFLRFITMPLGKPVVFPKDHLSREIGLLLTTPNAVRDRLTEGAFLTDCENNPVSQLEATLRVVLAAEPVERKIFEAIKKDLLPDRPVRELISLALSAGLIMNQQAELLKSALAARDAIVAVDDFDAGAIAGKRRA